jgi:hypothetical protein
MPIFETDVDTCARERVLTCALENNVGGSLRHIAAGAS